MALSVQKTDGVIGARVEGLDLSKPMSTDLISELRTIWLENKVLIVPNQSLSVDDLARFTLYFGEFGEDPFFGNIDEHPNIAAIQRNADEKTPIFAEIFHTDWSFLPIPPAGTCLYGIKIPPQGGNTLFADQVAAYEALSPELKSKVESLTAIHSAELGYAPTGAYGDADQDSGRSMKIIPSERAREKYEHPLVRVHPETGAKALFSSAAYIQGFKELEKAESDALLMELYVHQTQEQFVYSHPWQKNMLIMWDNRSLLHAATGGYDGYDRLLYRTTIADKRF